MDKYFSIEKANKEHKPNTQVMRRTTIKEFTEQAVNLTPGASITFFVTDEDGVTLEHGITCVQFLDSYSLLANCRDGGRSLVIDITEYDRNLSKISEELDGYVNDGSKTYGYVNVIQNVDDGQENSNEAPGDSDTYMLISVTERKITFSIFQSHEKAYEQMEQELYKTMDGDCEAYKVDDDYGICEDSAWSNADDDALSDWLIVKIPKDN